MRALRSIVALFALVPLAAAAQHPAAPPAPAVRIGERAPDFTLSYLAPLAGGKFEQKKVSLGDFAGKKTVILAFFPAAFSPG